MAFDIEKIDKAMRGVERFLRRNSKRPGSNAVHNLRTRIRSLETTFNTLGLDSRRKVKRLLRDLKAVRKRAGRVRDMDVLTGDVLTVKQDGEQDCLVQLIEHLGAERNKWAQKLRRLIRTSGSKPRRNLEQSSKRVDKILKEAGANSSKSDAVSATMAKSLQLSSDLHRPARLTRKNLHAYRLKVKELRNVLQMSEQQDGTFVEILGRVKDAIGDWHDWDELVNIAKQVLDHGNSCKLIRQLKGIRDSRYERALSLAEELRSQFLRPIGHEKRADSKAAQLSQPVLTAATAFARAS